ERDASWRSWSELPLRGGARTEGGRAGGGGRRVERQRRAVAAERQDALDSRADLPGEADQPLVVRQDEIGELDEVELGAAAGVERGEEIAVEPARRESREQAGPADLSARLDDDERAVGPGRLERAGADGEGVAVARPGIAASGERQTREDARRRRVIRDKEAPPRIGIVFARHRQDPDARLPVGDG